MAATPVIQPAAPAPVGTPPPFDAAYEGQIGLNTRTYGETNVGLDQQQSGALRSYGLDDPSDPFSRAALLRQHYEADARGRGNSLAARGQLYSGVYQNAQNSAASGYQQGIHGLREQQNATLATIAQRRSQARRNYEQGNLDAGAAAIDRATQNRPSAATLPVPVKPSVKGIRNSYKTIKVR